MTPPDEHSQADTTLAAPPPQCPAHAYGPGGVARLYGPAAEADPMGLYEQLRDRHGGVAPVLLHGDLPAWLILGYRENLDVTRTPSRFSRDSRIWRDMREGKLTPDHPLAPISTWQPICAFADGQVHERWRGAINDSLGRFDRRGVRRHITRFADQLVDTFCLKGSTDLVHEFAEPLPMLVMTQLLGMPEEYGPRLVKAARDMIKGTETAVASNEYVQEALRKLVARKRTDPGPDFTSWLLEHSSELTDDEVQQHLRLVLIAAFETTANLIANTLRMLLTDPRCRANLAGGHMTLPDAVEQVLWDEPPFTTILGRWATQDTELGGQKIKAGDALVLGLAAANVDTAIRPDPTTPVHGNRSHLAFSGGAHECPGQDIGRAIADTGIEALLNRLPDIQLAAPEDELRWISSLMSRHLVALPVKFTSQQPLPAERTEPVTTTAAIADHESGRALAPEQPTAIPAPPVRASGTRASRWRSLTRWFRRR
ncbi:cytochrome P450 [Streptomyces griseocarneus]|uniref:cytochrome P450 n=1 Tax=Streptomyces griseocarneus TaxID=51201 RepID=UPI0019870E4E|nr:cytochrome P450 [Streptomyces griseocarneus]MBZ6476351.1 cytochrome P450 [Streptomyces griseocarneus]GHG78049.1 cytochrome P450 [Streptomyces griseocarneus]